MDFIDIIVDDEASTSDIDEPAMHDEDIIDLYGSDEFSDSVGNDSILYNSIHRTIVENLNAFRTH